MSKELRRIFSLIFALALLMSLALPACAEGSISAAESDEFDEFFAEGSISGVEDDIFAESAPAAEIYVSAAGDDMGSGNREEPLATLAAAAELANAADRDTVYVILLRDVTVTKTARFLGKNEVLMSDEGSVLVSRGSGFETAYDDLRGAYHPAMIELGSLQGDQAGSASLSLDNVILDDAGLHEGGEFLAQSTDPAAEVNNLDRVQDAIIAVYGGSRLTIDPGSELRNFGGMSAVHAVGGAVTVEDFSFIHDTVAVASPAGLRAICAEGAQVRIGTEATVIERGAAAEDAAEEMPGEPAEEAPEETSGEIGEEASGEPAEEASEEASGETGEEASEEPGEEASEEPDEESAEDAAGAPVEESASSDGALAGESEPAEPQDGEDEGGDEGGFSWEELISGLTDIISDQIPELSRDFIENLLSGLSEDFLRDLLAQLLDDAGGIPDIIADLIGGGTDIPGIPSINPGGSTLSFTAPEELVEKEDAPYKVPYKASVKLPDSLVTVIKFVGTDSVESGRIRLIFKLDTRLDPVAGEDGKICSITGNLFEISEESYSEIGRAHV